MQLLWGGADSVVPMSPPIRTSAPTTTAASTTAAAATTPTITPKQAQVQARYARLQAARAPKPSKASLAAEIAAQLRAERAAAARARAAKAAAIAAQKKQGNSLVRFLINNQNNTNSTIVSLLNKLK